MRIISLASGSKGNAYCVISGDAALLIDCGLGIREFVARCKASSFDMSTIVGVVFTHSHTDHIHGAASFHKRFDSVPLFANLMTAEKICSDLALSADVFTCFENGQDFSVGPFTVHPFSIPHDTSDPVGYLVSADGETYFHGTDIGTPLDSIGIKLAQADVATLESNHDPVMLKTSNRPYSLIQRIVGPRGHLSNDQSCDLVRRFASPRLKRLALAHLSRDCNTPDFAMDAMRDTLAEMGREDIVLKVYSQNEVVEL